MLNLREFEKDFTSACYNALSKRNGVRATFDYPTSICGAHRITNRAGNKKNGGSIHGRGLEAL